MYFFSNIGKITYANGKYFETQSKWIYFIYGYFFTKKMDRKKRYAVVSGLFIAAATQVDGGIIANIQAAVHAPYLGIIADERFA